MDVTDMDQLVKDLSAGFEVLQDAYARLHTQHQALERKLATAREQYNELARLYDASENPTPPMSLSPVPGQATSDLITSANTCEILEKDNARGANEAAKTVRAAIRAAEKLRHRVSSNSGVKIWGGASADKPEAVSSMMPSISESPLEQDFTIEGKPSKLGCPFASMHNKKLSSHAASVLSRYNTTGSVAAASTPLSAVSRVNGKESMSRRSSTKRSFADPIKAEICGMPGHSADSKPIDIHAPAKDDSHGDLDVGVCPIRFLDQHSPEELATYFTKHKHELPRSHEVCIMRYQPDGDEVKQIDAKYGNNMVSMLQGLGAKHKDLLPEEPEVLAQQYAAALSDSKVRSWARSISAQTPEGAVAMQDGEAEENDADGRQSHFDRPLKDIRVGESPSRPWGISIPAQYLEKAEIGTSSRPAQVASPPVGRMAGKQQQEEEYSASLKKAASPPRCPFGHRPGAAKPPRFDTVVGSPPKQLAPGNDDHGEPNQKVTEEAKVHTRSPTTKPAVLQDVSKLASPQQMVFTGPVFIGYSPDDAVRFLRDAAFSQPPV